MALIGNSNSEKIWNYLKEKIGNEYGVAGLLGNIDAESALRPNNLQNTYERSLGFSDNEYVSAVDSGKYTNFVHDCAGFGICQWTYHSRKRKLLDYAKSTNRSIGDLEMQLDFLYKELSTGYKSVLTALKNATSVKEASNVVLFKFEAPADQGVAVQDKRASFGQKYYDKYATKSAPSQPTTPSKPASSNDVIYVVKRGDTLSKIASQYGTTYQELAQYNNISNPNFIRIGQKIKIPASGATKNWTPKVGDIVVYNGNQHYVNANALVGKKCKGGKAKITQIYQLGKSKHPYHLIAVSGSGSDVYGWVNAGTFTKA